MTRYAKAPSARLLGLLLVFGLLLVPASASALETHVFSTSFGEPCPSAPCGNGQLKLGGQSGLAVNQTTHDVYVADSGNGRVQQFSSAGAFIRAFGSLTAPTFIAIDDSPGGEGDVYVADTSDNEITKFEADGTLVSSWGTAGQLGVASGVAGIAVDSTGTLDVFTTATQMFEFEADGTPLTNFFTERGTAPFGLAVDPSGNFFKVNGNFTVEKFEGSGADVGQVDTAFATTGLTVDASSGTLYVDHGGLSIDTYAFNGAGEVIQSGSSCPIEPSKGCPATINFGSGSLTAGVGLAVDASTGSVYAADAGVNEIAVFTNVTLPDTSTEPADAIGPASATLHGTVSAAGGLDASCEFQYTTEESFQADKAKGQGHDGFGGATSVECTPHGPFSGSSLEAVSAPIANLNPGTDYRFRVVGANVNGSNPGQALGFLTPGPSAVSATVTNITTTAATLTGFFNPRGKAFSYHVDYGPSASYGTSIPVPDAAAEATPIATANITFGFKKVEGVVMSQGAFAVGQDIVGEGIPAGTTVTAVEGSTLTLSNFPEEKAAGSGITLTSTTVFVSQPITGLTPGTEYHARLVATNADGTTLGPDRGFSTYPVDTGLPDGRAYEMVSPTQKLGEVFAPEPSGSLGGSCSFEFCLPGLNDAMLPMQATADGEALAFVGQPFSSGLASSSNQYVAKRSSAGWATRGITPPRSATGRQSGFHAFSADLTRGVLFQATPALSEEVPPGENGKDFNDLYLWEAGNPDLRPLVTVKPPHRTPTLPGNPNAFELFFAGGNAGSGEAPAFSHLVFEANDALTGAVATVAPAAPEVGEGRCEGFATSDCNLYGWIGGQLRLVNVLPGNEAAATHAVIGSGHRLTVPNPEFQSANVDHAISADGSRIFWSDESGQVYVRIEDKETVEVKDPGQFLTASADGSKVLLNDGCLYDLEAESCEASLSGSPSAFLGILGASEDLSRIYFADTEALAGAPEAGTCKTPSNEPGLGEEAEGKVPAGLGCNVYAYDEGEVSFITALNEMDNNFGTGSQYGDWKAAPSNRTAQVSAEGRYLTFTSYARLTGYDNRVAGGGDCPKSLGPACFKVFEYDLETDSLSCPSCNPSGQRPLGKSNLSLIRPTPGSSFPQPENLPANGEGRLFFESGDVLTTADTNGHINDVYEWTPNGVGTCKRTTGCIALVSSGHSPNDSFFLNSTPSGNDAFFVTREQLLPRDKDDFLDVYDARVNGGIAEEITPPCVGEACKGASSNSPAADSPGTSTFSGPPNKKHHKHKKHRKHKAKKAHKRSAQHKKTGGSK